MSHTPPRGNASLDVTLLTHYYPPELGAPQTRLHETARGLLGLGHRVRIVTGPPHYPDGHVRPGYTAGRPAREVLDGVPMLRLPMIPRRNGGLLDRVIDQVSFSASALAAAAELRPSSVVLVESPPLFLGLTAAAWRLMTGRPYLFHVADPWPDFPIQMGALTDPLLQQMAYGIEALAYARASLITTVTPGLVDLLETKPAARGKVRLLPNAVDTGRFRPARRPAEARAELGWPEARLNLVYAGSVGLAQGLGTLLEAVAPLGDEGIVVHVVGQGFERADLARSAVARGLAHLRFEEAVSADRVPDFLAAADAILVLLRAGGLYEHALPTKLLEALAAGRPLVVSAAGEAGRLVAAAGAGVVARPEDADALRDAIRSLADGGVREAMGRAARAVAESHYERRVVTSRLADYLAQIARDDLAR